MKAKDLVKLELFPRAIYHHFPGNFPLEHAVYAHEDASLPLATDTTEEGAWYLAAQRCGYKVEDIEY